MMRTMCGTRLCCLVLFHLRSCVPDEARRSGTSALLEGTELIDVFGGRLGVIAAQVAQWRLSRILADEVEEIKRPVSS